MHHNSMEKNISAFRAILAAVTMAVACTANLQSDDFRSSDLSSWWTSYDPVGDASMSIISPAGGFECSVPAGVGHDMWKGSKNRAPRIYQSISGYEDFEVEVHFNPATLPNTMSTEYQMHGLFIPGATDTDFMKFGSYSDENSNKWFVAYIYGNKALDIASGTFSNGPPDRLKVACVSRACTYSTSKQSTTVYTEHVTTNVPTSMSVTGVGIYCGNAGRNRQQPAFTTLAESFTVTGAVTHLSASPSSPPSNQPTDEPQPSASPSSPPSNQPTDEPQNSAFSDTFTSTGLDSRWIVEKAGVCSDVTSGGVCKVYPDGSSLIFHIPSGSNHAMWTDPDDNNAPRVLQPIEDKQTFILTTKFESRPRETDQMQGLVVAETLSKFIRFGCYIVSGQLKLSVAMIDGISNPTVYIDSDALFFPGRMRLERSGDEWTAKISAIASTDFILVATFNQPVVANHAGIYAGNGGNNNPEYIASCDFFEIDSDPITDIDHPITVIPVVASDLSVWSGLVMYYGAQGIGQNWLNIVGRAPFGTTSMSYTLRSNSALCSFQRTPQSCGLRLGPDGNRLVETGDFNLELSVDDLFECSTYDAVFYVDLVILGAYPQTETVEIVFAASVLLDPNFVASWSTDSISDYGQIVDGNWEIDSSKQVLRNLQVGYDRLMTVGDRDWTTNYEVLTSFILSPDPSISSRIGFAMGWRGHKGKQSGVCDSLSKLQTTWPVEAIIWVRGGESLEIWTNPPAQSSAQNRTSLDSISGMGDSLRAGETYFIRSSIQPVLDINDVKNNFVQTKIWKMGQSEPNWLLAATFPLNEDNQGRGSVLLLAHRTKVEFGPVEITPLP